MWFFRYRTVTEYGIVCIDVSLNADLHFAFILRFPLLLADIRLKHNII